MNDRQRLLLLSLPMLVASLLAPGGCATFGAVGAASRTESSGDRWGMANPGASICDFGILRGTKDMHCEDEFKRKAWF